MKKLLLALFLTGCTAAAANKAPDAGVYSVHVENQFKYYHDKYCPICIRHCEANTGSDECPAKCEKDFLKIKEVLARAVRDNREDDFAEMMESWYGQN